MKPVFYAAVVCQFVLKSNSVENNVCPTFKDYYTIKNNPNCWYDFAADSNVEEIIIRNGYAVETHKVTTMDGYILTMFRIPNYKKETLTPVLLLHGWLNSAAVFVARGRDSLAFSLADAGYDVWLGNFRGTEYSEGHVNLTVFDKQYWDYSIDELAVYDIPAQLELIVKKTEQKGNVILIGHSLGTTAALIYSSLFPTVAQENFKLFIFLAPFANGSHTKSPLFRVFGPFFGLVLRMANGRNFIRLVSHAETMKNVSQLICLKSSPAFMELCTQALNRFVIGPQTQTEPSLIPVVFNQMPAGISFKVGKQIADFSRNSFGRYNYSVEENIKKYGTTFPPQYNVSKAKVPTFIMYAVNDWICTKEDSLILYSQLSTEAKYGIHEISEPNFNHLDFVFGRNSKALVGDRILNLLQQISFFATV